jgi:hypothetical protein
MLDRVNRDRDGSSKEGSMNIVSRKISAVILGATLGAVVVGGAQAGTTTVPTGFSAQQWNALQIRSQALDQKYHLGAYRSTSVGGDSAQAERALMIRSDALNRKYHLGRYAIVRPTRQASGFDWGDAGIGSAATLGLVLAAIGATVGARRYRVQRSATA